MTYAYGMKGAPAVGGGLGGLPRRIQGRAGDPLLTVLATFQFPIVKVKTSSTFTAPSDGWLIVEAFAGGGAGGGVSKYVNYTGNAGGNTVISGDGWEIVLGGGGGGYGSKDEDGNIVPAPQPRRTHYTVGLPPEVVANLSFDRSGHFSWLPDIFTTIPAKTLQDAGVAGGGNGRMFPLFGGDSKYGSYSGNWGSDGANSPSEDYGSSYGGNKHAYGGQGGSYLRRSPIPVRAGEVIVFTIGAGGKRSTNTGGSGGDGVLAYQFISEESLK